MADHGAPSEPTLHTSSPSRPLLSALTRFWSPAAAPASEPELGYESALPWTLDEATGRSAGQPQD